MNGYMKLKEYMRYFVVPFIIAIVAVFLTYVLELSITYAVILVVIVFIISLLIISLLIILDLKKDIKLLEKGDKEDSRTSFLGEVFDRRGAAETEKEINIISEARENVKILGISHQTLWANSGFMSALIRAGVNHVKITSLILDPDGYNLNLKADDEGRYDQDIWKNEIKSKIGRFKKLKNEYPTIDLELYTYDIFPIWHMVIIDNKIGLIGYYPTGGPGGDSPLYLITEDDLSLLTPFIKYFNSIKDSGKRIIPK